MGKITDVTVKPCCISCGTCESICPQIFQVRGTSQVVGTDFEKYATKILEAEQSCPVQVISVTQEETATSITVKKLNTSLIDTKRLTKDVITLYLKCPNFNFLPGQFISVHMEDSKGLFQRCYSITGYEKSIIELCVRVVPEGRGAVWWGKIQKNTPFKISPACGRFVLQNTKNPKVFIATGTGLAPLLSMLATTDPKVQKTVIMGVRSENECFHVKRLSDISNTKVIYTVSQPSESYAGPRGRVTNHLKELPLSAKTEIYICGNPAMVESVRQLLKKRKHPVEKTFYEEFTPAPDSTIESQTQTKILNMANFRLVVTYATLAVPLGLPFFYTSFRKLGMALWIILTGVLLIRPLSNIFPNFKILRVLISLRKEFGILVGVLVLTHSYGYFLNYKLPLSDLVQPAYWQFTRYFAWALVGAIAGIITLVTSNQFSARLLGHWWKRLQYLVYVLFFAGGMHIWLIGKNWAKPALYSMLLVTGVWILAHLKYSINIRKNT